MFCHVCKTDKKYKHIILILICYSKEFNGIFYNKTYFGCASGRPPEGLVVGTTIFARPRCAL